VNAPQPPHGLHAPGEPEHTANDLVEAIAQRTAELVLERLTGGQMPAGLVDARTVADALGCSAETVRDHADELGVVRLGDGPRPRLRFDLATARVAWSARSGSGRSQPSDPPMSSGRRPRKVPPNVELVPIRRPNGDRRAA
jgi:hypothetical protein